jgi:NadR type nicotinamide-nucleotide adenylyltransferase
MPNKAVRGLVCGKFYPLHKGHDYLIRTAMRQCDSLTIMIVQQPDQRPPGELRKKWLEHAYPETEIVLVDDIYKDGDHQAWADFTVSALGYAPDVVFSSEKYGESWSAGMGSRHVLVDPGRERVPVSASEIRRNPKAHQEFLNDEVRNYYLQNDY